jgi:hypothetical protein
MTHHPYIDESGTMEGQQREERFAKVTLHYADMKKTEKFMTAEVFGRAALKK